MKKLKDKKLTSAEPDSSLFQQDESYEIVYAHPQDEEINLKFLKKSQISAHMARWFLDHEYNQLIWSDGIFEILELDPRKYGANFASFIEMVHPEDREMKNQAQENLRTTFKPLEINYRLQFSDGRIKWINEICNTDFDREGNPIRSYGTIQDITKYKLTEENFKQKEEQFQSLIESIPTGIAIIQEDKFVFVNPSGRKILGGNQEESFKGKDISKIIHSKSRQSFSEKFESVNKGDLLPTFEETLVRQDGSVFNAEITLIKIPYLGTSAIQLIVNDITDRKKTEEALLKSEEKYRLLATTLTENEDRLKDLVATKDKFFSIIAHDLRSPFNSIIGFLELLLSNYESLNDAEKKSYLKLIDDDTKKTLKLLDNLLEWAKVQTGKISFDPKNQKLSPILKSVEDTIEASLKLKLLQLKYKGMSDRIEVFGDTNMLTTIFRNLISNAIKYSHPGGTITVHINAKSDQLEFIIEDSGIGMNEEAKKRIFVINEQISTPGTANETGSGLGLILCKDFVERHNGKIWVESEIGIGTKIGFSIPY
jgi:PAS domain S-box-containing protein